MLSPLIVSPTFLSSVFNFLSLSECSHLKGSDYLLSFPLAMRYTRWIESISLKHAPEELYILLVRRVIPMVTIFVVLIIYNTIEFLFE